MSPVQIPAPSLQRRFVGLDGYRFIAAFGVMLFHYEKDFGLGLERWTPAPQHFYLMVDFFFILSGFVIASSYWERMNGMADYRSFLRSRFARLYPLHFVTLLASLSLLAISAIFHITPNNPRVLELSGLPANALMIHAWGVLDHLSFNAASWSISAEWFAYLLTPLFFLTARRLPLIVCGALTVAIIGAIMFVRHKFGYSSWTDMTYDFGALRAAPLFMIGVIIARGLPDAAAPLRYGWWLAHLLFFGVLLVAHFSLPAEISLVLFALLIGVAARCEAADLPSFMRSPVMGRLGDASYGTYMLQMTALPVLFVLRKYGMLGTPLAAFACIATMLVVVGTAMLSHRYFEMPMRKWVVKVLTPAAKPAASSPLQQAQG